LVDQAGEAVAITYSELVGDMEVLGVYTPAEDLQPGMRYTALDSNGRLLTTFTAGTEALTAGPELPEEISREAHSDARGPTPLDSCGYSDLVEIRLRTDGLFVVANVTGADELDAETLSGTASQMSFDRTLRIGTAGCTFSWPDAEPNATTEVRYGAFDLAGNFSGWTEADKITLPAAGTTGCSAAGSAAPTFAMLLLGLVAIRRR
jgi:uncharacterized protein (TIGR03382 family)